MTREEFDQCRRQVKKHGSGALHFTTTLKIIELAEREAKPECGSEQATSVATVSVRIPIAIDSDGNWGTHAWGYDDGEPVKFDSTELIWMLPETDGPHEIRWITAVVPLPTPDITGTVE